MKNSKFTALVSLFSLMGILASCGPAGGSGSSSGSSPADPTNVTFDFWHTFGSGNDQAINAKINEFVQIIKEEENVNLTVNSAYQGNYDDILNKIEKSFAAGTTPTLAVAYPDHVANYMYNEPTPGAYVENIQPLIDDPEIGLGKESHLGDTEGEDDFIPAFIDEGRHFTRDGTYTIPYMKSSELLFYNYEAVERALTTYDPTVNNAGEFMKSLTWDEFFEFAAYCKENQHAILSTMDIPVYYDSDSNLFISKMYQNEIGYSSIDDNGKGVVDFETGTNREQAEAMVKQFRQYKVDGLLTTKGLEGTYASDAFTNGETMFSIGSTGGTGYNLPSAGSGWSVGVCPVPASNDNPLYVSQGPSLTLLRNQAISDAENDLKIKYAWKLVKYITNADNNVELTLSSQGYLPVRLSAFTTDIYLDFISSDPNDTFVLTAQTMLEDIDGNYLNTPVFTGSAKLRDAAASIITESLKASSEDQISEIFTTAINNAKLSFN